MKKVHLKDSVLCDSIYVEVENRLEIAWVRALGRGVGVSHSNRIAGRGDACGDGTALHLDCGCGYRELHPG